MTSTVEIKLGTIRISGDPFPKDMLHRIADIFFDDEYRLSLLDLDGTVLDIGARIGEFTLAVLHWNPNARIIAFEPLPWCRNAFIRNVQNSFPGANVTLIEGAVIGGNEIKKGVMYKDISQAFCFPTNGVHPLVETFETTQYGILKVLEMYGPVKLLKMDCEGCEKLVLPSLQEIGFEGVEQITMEWHDAIGLYDYGWAYHMLSQHYKEVKYTERESRTVMILARGR